MSEFEDGTWKVNLAKLGNLGLPVNPYSLLFPKLGQDECLVVLDTRPSHSFESHGLPRLDQIPLSEQLINGHPLSDFIEKVRPLSSADFAELLKSEHIDLSISGYKGGAVPAAVPSSQEWADPMRYDQNLWLRDWALDYLAVHRTGNYARAHQMLRNVCSFLGSEDERGKITSMHFPKSDPAGRFARNDGSPRSKFAITPDNGKLGDCKTGWAHQQIDAFTAFLDSAYRTANIEAVESGKALRNPNGRLFMPLDLRSMDPQRESKEHLLPAFMKALRGMKIWDAYDVGPWEDLYAHQRATGNGLATSMIAEVKLFHEKFGWNFLHVNYGNKENPEKFREDMLDLGKRCKEVLDRRIPESGFAIECSRRPHDAALLLLLYPFRADLSENQQLSILRTAYANMGEVGFSRFLATLDHGLPHDFKGHPSEIKGEPDLFVGQDYHRNTNSQARGEFAANVAGYKPAQWSLFDPLLAGYYYRRYIESGGIDTESLLYADRHLKRSLAFIVPEDTEIFIEGKKHELNSGKFPIPKGSLPEAMCWDSKLGKFIYNHNNLLMSRAVLAMAIERGIEATRFFEHIEVRH